MTQTLHQYPELVAYLDTHSAFRHHHTAFSRLSEVQLRPQNTLVNTPRGLSMAQSLVQLQPKGDYGVDEGASAQVLPVYQSMPQAKYPFSGPADGALSGSVSGLANSAWGDAALAGISTTWNGEVPMEPFIVSDADYQLGTSGDIAYETILHGQGLMPKPSGRRGTTKVWSSPGMTGLPCGAHRLGGSDLDTDASSSPSPKSYFSKLSEHDLAFTTDVTLDHPTQSDKWATGHLAMHDARDGHSPHQTPTGAGLSDSLSAVNPMPLDYELLCLQPVGMDFSMPTVESAQTGGTMSERVYTNGAFDSSSTGLTRPYFSKRHPGTIPWPTSSQVPPPYHQNNSFAYSQNGTLVPYVNALGSDTILSGPWNGQGNTVATEDYHTDNSVDIQVQRKDEDRVLLEGKAAGLTYKEIKKKLGTKVAESTLRGRYRSLTKARKDRVRKPVWTERDVKLLQEIVSRELNRNNRNNHTPSRNQRLTKLSWKKIADYIADHGGSYHFGNSTCKKKWTEIQGHR